MKLTEEQKVAVKQEVELFLQEQLGLECGDAGSIADSLLPDIVSDIEETADWSDFEDDEVCLGDVHLAIGRVMTKRITEKKKVIVLTSEWSIDYENDYLVKVFDADKMDLAKEEMKMDFENFKKEWFYWDEFTIDDRCATASVRGEYSCNHCTWDIREIEVITE